MLTPRDERLLRVTASRHVPSIVLGLILIIVGGAYGFWAVQQLNPQRAPVSSQAFDGPIARVSRIFANEQERLSRLHTTTALETELVSQLKAQVDLTTRWLLALLRLMISSMLMTVGFIMLTAGLAQRGLLRIIETLRTAGSPTPNRSEGRRDQAQVPGCPGEAEEGP